MVEPATSNGISSLCKSEFKVEMDLCCCSYKNGSSLKWNYNTTSFEDLPDGLVFDILSRLPVKTLLQSICVCKLWFFIIKSPSFISAHLSRSISNPSSYYIFLSHHYSPSVTVISDNPLIIRHPDFKFPFETHSTYLELLGACNGLICVTDPHPKYRRRDIYVINPFIHKYKKLGVESSCYEDLILGRETNFLNIGFGYCELEDDYKVLRVIKHPADTTKSVYAYKVEVYSLKRGEWKAVDVSIATELAPSISPSFIYGCTYMHGCLYWRGVHVTHVEDYLKLDEYLLCFDLKDELFSRIELPKTYFQLSWAWHSGVFVKNGSLAIVLCSKDPESVSPFTKICLLMLEKKSGGQIKWEEFNYECADFNPSNCIGLCGGGRLIFVDDSDLLPQDIVAVDLDNSCAIERLTLDFTYDDDDDINEAEAANVSESLVLLSDLIT